MSRVATRSLASSHSDRTKCSPDSVGFQQPREYNPLTGCHDAHDNNSNDYTIYTALGNRFLARNVTRSTRCAQSSSCRTIGSCKYPIFPRPSSFSEFTVEPPNL